MTNNEPTIRFAGHTDEWSRSLLSEYLTTSSEKNKQDLFSKDDVLSVSREYGVVNQIEYQGKSFAGASLTGYGIVRTRDVVYTKSPLRDQPYGVIKANKGKDGIVSALYAVYTPKDNLDPDFVQVYFDSDERLNGYLRPIVRKGAKNTLNVSDDDAISGIVCFPLATEQSKIVELFGAIDNSITFQNQLIESLQKSKAALQTKIYDNTFHEADSAPIGFEKRGSLNKVAGDDVFVTVSDKGHTDLPILSASQEQGMLPRTEIGIDMSYGTANIASYKRVLPGQFVIHLRSFQGGFAHSSIEGITSPAYTVMRLKNPEQHDALFWKHLLLSPQFIKELAKVTYGIRDGKSIKFEDFAKLVFMVPDKDGQHKIALILDEFAKLIQLNKLKLEKLRQLKTALLEKMFV